MIDRPSHLRARSLSSSAARGTYYINGENPLQMADECRTHYIIHLVGPAAQASPPSTGLHQQVGV